MNVLYVPGLQYGMLSASIMDEAGCSVTFENGGVSIKRDDRVLADVTRTGYHYISSIGDPQASTTSDAALIDCLSLWHERLAHGHVDGIRNMARNKIFTGMEVDITKA